MEIARRGFSLVFAFALFVFLLEVIRNSQQVVPLLNSFTGAIGSGLSMEIAAGGGGGPTSVKRKK